MLQVSNEIVEEAEESNPMYFPRFIKYFLQTWASNIHLWTAIILNLVKSEVKFNNQVCFFPNSNSF